MPALSETLSQIKEGTLIREGHFEFLHKAGYATQPRTLTFISENKYVPIIGKNANISSVICTKEIAGQIQNKFSVGIIVHENPRELFYKIHLRLSFCLPECKPTVIDPSAKVLPLAMISPHNVRIGRACIIEEGAVIKPGVFIGDNAKIRSGVVLGAEGYEVTKIDGRNEVIPHLGELHIGRNVDIFSNSTICKAIFCGAKNIIEDDVFIDCLVHVAHGVTIRKGAKIVAHAVIAGNVVIGENAWVGPGAVISNGITIGNGAFVAIGSVVISDLPSGKKVSGNFAIDHDKNLLRHI